MPCYKCSKRIMTPSTWLVDFYVLLADITKPNINQTQRVTASSVNVFSSNDLWKLYQIENNLFTTFALIASIRLRSPFQKVNRGACWTAGSGYCTMSLFWDGCTINNVSLKFCYFFIAILLYLRGNFAHSSRCNWQKLCRLRSSNPKIWQIIKAWRYTPD